MPQQVCDVSKLRWSQLVWIANQHRILGFVPSFFFSTSYERLVKAEQACPNFEHVERERARQMPQQVCDVSKSGVN
jgi:hypothetical protein